ncbi:MAG: PEP-CTERM sorting domain-containing protein [Bryobacterales bacterium]|nr:PEP-CTERM sorting domain-containing protein [Bryobacterales bacterium]
MKRHLIVLTLIGAITLIAGVPGLASTLVYSSFEPEDTFSGGWSIGRASITFSQDIAVSFTPGFDGSLHSIQVPIWHATGPNEYEIRVAEDSGGIPGATLELFAKSFPASSTMVTLNSVENPMLSAGSTYWIWMTAVNLEETRGSWGYVGNKQHEFSYWLSSNGDWRVFEAADYLNSLPNAGGPAFAVYANGIPEPSTILLTLGGLVALLTAANRRRIGASVPSSR